MAPEEKDQYYNDVDLRDSTGYDHSQENVTSDIDWDDPNQTFSIDDYLLSMMKW